MKILVLNAGSSSVKYQLFNMTNNAVLASGIIEQIGEKESMAKIKYKASQYIIYADNCLLEKDFMLKHHIIFKKIPRDINFGDGNSDKKFFELLQKNSFWKISNQKQFKDL